MKKIVLLVFVLVLLSTAVVVRFVRPAVANETIHIRSDGSVEGTDKIQRDGNVYTFTDNIYDEIVVERDDIVLDGAGYTLQGTESGTGIKLTDRSNVTIKNIKIKDFDYGISLQDSSNNTISGNIVTNNEGGIAVGGLIGSPNNTIYGNNITANNNYGIYCFVANNNSIHGNNIKNNNYSIWLTYSSDNKIYHNNFIDNTHQVYVEAIPDIPPSINVWDDGYPSGGNYWSDYEDRYPDAEEIDGSGIWNTPYVIDENNQDNYPIVPEFPTWTSMLLLLIVLTVATAIYKRRLLKTI